MKANEEIGAIGVTHYAESMYPEMIQTLETGKVDVVQVPYNINQTRAAQEIFPIVQQQDIGVLIMTPITQLFRRGVLLQKVQQIDLTRFKKYGCTTPGQVLLKFAISHRAITAAIPATSKVSRIGENTAISNGLDMDPIDQDFLTNL